MSVKQKVGKKSSDPTLQDPNKHDAWFQTSRAKNRGISAKNLQQKAVLTSTNNLARKKSSKKETSNSSVLSDRLEISYEKDTSSWSASPKKVKDSDESLALQGEHHIRAFTKLDNSKDFDISAGPELIVKESKQNTALNNNTDQPQSEVGVGMHFMYNF